MNIKKNIDYLVITTVFTLLISGCGCREQSRISTGGPEKVNFRVLQFDLNDVKLLDGPFLDAARLNMATLLNYDPDRLLSRFYDEAGLKPRAVKYLGWENESLAGHSLGHYLSACSQMYKATGDERFRQRSEYIVSELKFLQDHDGEGYIGAFPEGKRILGEEVASGKINSQGFYLNGIWAPFYTQHKMLAGLRDCWRLCGNNTALHVERSLADWIGTVVMKLNEEEVQKMLVCEHGGISETMADLYADTGDEKYLRLSKIFYHRAILDPLKNGEDILPGRHCNTNIPKLISLARLYELTADSTDRAAAEFFWHTVIKNHSYVTGGNGNDEYFGPAGKLRNRLGEGTTESCNVYNMLKLTEHLFMWEASAEAADYYERALFNHILSSQNPETGEVTYNLSLDMGGFKSFQDPYEFTCCIGTGMENHSKYGKNIYYHNNNELFVFQFIASELNWNEQGLKLIQNTEYPEEQGSSFIFNCINPLRMALHIRYPYWAENGIEIKVNGKSERIGQKPGSFIRIERTWKSGDVVDVRIPFSLRLESMPDDSNRIAVMYGPLVMAGELGPMDDKTSGDAMYVPVLLTEDRVPQNWIRQVAGETNSFRTINTGRPREVGLRPFYKIYNKRYSVYWDMLTEAGWTERQNEYHTEKEKLMKLIDAELDFVQAGEEQQEKNHGFKGEKTAPWTFKDKPYREARNGWFMFDMKVDPDIANSVVVEYWGGFPGAKTFDILAGERVIATENITNKKEGHFIFVVYNIPEEITRGKKRISVKFQSHSNNTAGPVFAIRTIKKTDQITF